MIHHPSRWYKEQSAKYRQVLRPQFSFSVHESCVSCVSCFWQSWRPFGAAGCTFAKAQHVLVCSTSLPIVHHMPTCQNLVAALDVFPRGCDRRDTDRRCFRNASGIALFVPRDTVTQDTALVKSDRQSTPCIQTYSVGTYGD